MTAGAEMPSYRSHKEVWALQIDRIERSTDFGDTRVRLVFINAETYAPRWVEAAVVSRHMPEHGDYFVVYRDGYESISPQKEFEDGYTLIGSTP